MRLRNYLRRDLAAPPVQVDYTLKAQAGLSLVYMNDSLGCCTISGVGHIVGVLTGNSGIPTVTFTDDQIVAMYSACGGYIVGDASTDQGCDEVTVLNYWQQHGIAGSHKTVGRLSVNPADRTEVMTAIDLFENVYYGVELPDAWITPFPSSSGFTWNVAGAPDPDNGHCFIGAGYTQTGVKICTWGLLGEVEWAATAEYASAGANGALYVVLSPEIIAKASLKAPSGVDWVSLIADFDTLGGTVPVPAPVPAPIPAPTGPITVAAAVAVLAAAFATAAPLVTRSQAIAIGHAALTKAWPTS
jgi:hypothetical protein